MKRKHPLAECEKCPLQANPCAPTQKPPQAKAALVSRSPGKYEAMAGKPFSGPSGKVVDFLLKQNGLSRREVMLSNVVLCTIEGTQVPSEAIKACSGRLRAELDGIPLVIAAGREAVNLLIGRGSIDRYRGYSHHINGRRLVATNNPALVLRDDSTFPNLKKDFKRAFNPNPPTPYPKVEVIEDGREARDYIRSLQENGGRIGADVESRGGLTHKASLISLQFSTDGVVAYVLGERGGLFLDTSFINDFLKPLFGSRDHSFIWHQGKFDCKILRHTYGIEARVDEDTILLSYALDERTGGDDAVGIHALEYLLMEEFGWPNYSNARIERAKKTGVVEDYDEFYEYAGRDVGGTKSLFDLYIDQAEKDDVLSPYRNILLRATNELLIPAELHGMVYNVNHAANLYEFEVKPELDDLTGTMRKHLDNQDFKPTSPQQVSKVLYDDWGIQHDMRKRPDKNRSVDEAARKEILADRFTFRGSTIAKRHGTTLTAVAASDAEERRDHYKHFIKDYDRFQKLQKQCSTYIVSLVERAETDEEARIYTDLLLFGTNSGRLSSRRPNLQNITRTREGLPNIRSLFRASRGRVIVNADFSQAELRCIAQFSHDKLLWSIYEEGRDLHNECASRFYGENFTKHNRDVAKNVNFGVFYRQTAATFQEKHDIPEKEAQPYIDWVWRTFTGVAQWEKNIEAEIHSKGVLVSPFGRKRRFHLLTEYNCQAAYREGINFYPQTTASDLTLTSAIRLAGEIDPRRAIVVLLVHDSILGDVQDSYVDEFSVICKQIMQSQARDELEWTLPFKADIQVGDSWGSVQ